MILEPNSAYEYQVGGSLPFDAPTYVVRQADSELVTSKKITPLRWGSGEQK